MIMFNLTADTGQYLWYRPKNWNIIDLQMNVNLPKFTQLVQLMSLQKKYTIQ